MKNYGISIKVSEICSKFLAFAKFSAVFKL